MSAHLSIRDLSVSLGNGVRILRNEPGRVRTFRVN